MTARDYRGTLYWLEHAPVPSPPPKPRFELALVGAVRSTALAPDAQAFVNDAKDYGWRAAAPRPLVGWRLDGHALWMSMVDVGASLAWMTGEFAAGVDNDGDRMGMRWIEATASARLRWAGGRPFVPEPRIDVGVAQARWLVHQVASDSLRTFVRVSADWRLGTRRAGANLSVGYTAVGGERVDGPSPPHGGLDLALGPYVRF